MGGNVVARQGLEVRWFAMIIFDSRWTVARLTLRLTPIVTPFL
jgi:hypothetical protein